MIYLDSCVLIYAVEDQSNRGETVRAALAQALEPLATSPLVLNECLVGVLEDGNLELRDRYLALHDGMQNVALDTDVFVRAAELRAQSGLRTPDALHLAAAQLSGCTALWTNDRRLAAASHGLAIDIIGGDAGRPNGSE